MGGIREIYGGGFWRDSADCEGANPQQGLAEKRYLGHPIRSNHTVFQGARQSRVGYLAIGEDFRTEVCLQLVL